MRITSNRLKDWNACKEGYEWFLRRFPDGDAEYQDVLNALAEDDRPNDADWLMSSAGPDREAVLEVDVIADRKHFFAAGWLVVKTSIAVNTRLRAGSGIEAGSGIKAGEGIEAGSGHGIFAGLSTKLADWTVRAKVIAKTMPDNLISGSWVVEPLEKAEKVEA